MTARRELRCLQNTIVLRMYCILNKAIEDLLAFRIGAYSRGNHGDVFALAADLDSYRISLPPAAVCLTEPKASWAGTDAFEIRWTSLAA